MGSRVDGSAAQGNTRKENVRDQKKVGKKTMNLIFEHVKLRNMLNVVMLSRYIGVELREF